MRKNLIALHAIMRALISAIVKWPGHHIHLRHNKEGLNSLKYFHGISLSDLIYIERNLSIGMKFGEILIEL